MANPVLTRVWFKVVVATELSAYPVTWPEEPVAVQVNWVPDTDDRSVIFVGTLLQIDLLGGALLRSGTGFTVATKLATGPSQLLACGVIW